MNSRKSKSEGVLTARKGALALCVGADSGDWMSGPTQNVRLFSEAVSEFSLEELVDVVFPLSPHINNT